MSRPRTHVGHGVYSWAKKQKCPCAPCREACSIYAKRLKYDHHTGRGRKVDAEPLREHIYELLEHGPRATVAHAIGIYPSVLDNILDGKDGKGPAPFVLRPTAAKIWATTVEKVQAEPRMVDAVGIRRRVQALEYMGYTKAMLARELGVNESQVFSYVKSVTSWTTTIEKIHEVYVRLRDVPGPSQRARFSAYRNDWRAPMCWDDETIDDPEATPGPAACVAWECTRQVKRRSLCVPHLDFVRKRKGLEQARYYTEAVLALRGRELQDGERALQEVRQLREIGFNTPAEVAYRLGKTKEYVERLWEDAG